MAFETKEEVNLISTLHPAIGCYGDGAMGKPVAAVSIFHLFPLFFSGFFSTSIETERRETGAEAVEVVVRCGGAAARSSDALFKPKPGACYILMARNAYRTFGCAVVSDAGPSYLHGWAK